jgi:hypothetical protein
MPPPASALALAFAFTQNTTLHESEILRAITQKHPFVQSRILGKGKGKGRGIKKWAKAEGGKE